MLGGGGRFARLCWGAGEQGGWVRGRYNHKTGKTPTMKGKNGGGGGKHETVGAGGGGRCGGGWGTGGGRV